ncbi:MAG: prepilin-type N-terminal cleavage/methylation domain-containing protein [Desulfobulbaceae bacterium]|nr:prepilin-type N-terminal cleavage/methylation domain-containing protein [Desulfobulbaceae bacterium]
MMAATFPYSINQRSQYKQGRKNSAEAGFTLLEVMIAVAIIAIAMVTLIGSQSQSVSIAAISRFDTVASLLARQKLVELETGDYTSLTSDEGYFSDDFAAYHWMVEVTDLNEDDTGIEGTDDMLKAVDLTVTFGEDGQTFSLRSIIMRTIEAREEP